MVTELEGAHPRQVEVVGAVEGHLFVLGTRNTGLVVFAVVQHAEIQYADGVELQGGAQHHGALVRRGAVVVAVGVETQGKGVILDQAGAQRLVEYPRREQLVTVHPVDFAAAMIGAFARVIAVGKERIDIEEVAAIAIAVGVGEAVDALGNVLGIVRVGELRAVAKTDAVVHPFNGIGLPHTGHGNNHGDALYFPFHYCCFPVHGMSGDCSVAVSTDFTDHQRTEYRAPRCRNGIA
ncbi:hypothetical protein D3C85_919100 [compost metagenome]